MRKYIDLSGKRFWYWTVISFSHKDKFGAIYFSCKCDCGKTRTVRSSQLIRGISKSCGCYHSKIASDNLRKIARTHGLSSTRTYKIWEAMLYRCTKPSSTSFYKYGARGIKVCKRWHKFENFFSDMGHPPTDKHSIDRINNNGDYTPRNCKWATCKEQSNNTRRVRKIAFRGNVNSIKQWSEKLGINYGTLITRFNEGWGADRALLEPIHKKNYESI